MNQVEEYIVTEKGVDEVNNRAYKIGVKGRSILLLLSSPHSIPLIIKKTAFSREDVISQIIFLSKNNFIKQYLPISTTSSGNGSAGQGQGQGQVMQIPERLRLHEDSIISEAKFLLSDFAMDNFYSQAQELCNEVRAGKTVLDVQRFLLKLYTMTHQSCPSKKEALLAIVVEINQTAC